MDINTEQILIIYSVNGTRDGDLTKAKEAIQCFVSPVSNVRATPIVFDVPSGAAPGSTLGTELSEQLKASIGAVVFIDDLRPNVAYELGFFHGQGRTVLLLTRERVDSVWTAISDLAGAALAQLDIVELTTAIHSYLNRLYAELSSVRPWPTIALPSQELNLFTQLDELSGRRG